MEQLGKVLGAFALGSSWPGLALGLTAQEHAAFEAAIARAEEHNGWFTQANIRHALGNVSQMLSPSEMGPWLDAYALENAQAKKPRGVGIVMAGNVPLVGFHDLLCTLLAGHIAQIKPSTQDLVLLSAVLDLLSVLAPGIEHHWVLRNDRLGRVDALLATGSNNTARYFDHYFRDVPRLVRKGRVGVAVLDGTETDEELMALGEDVFRYFGLGCRNVAKLYLPKGYDPTRVYPAWLSWGHVADHHKWANNYTYNRALWLMDSAPFLDNNFLVLKEDAGMASPVGALYYEFYANPAEVLAALASHTENIQCVVGHGYTPFGHAQRPGPANYADNMDTLAFLLEKVS
jgi:Acyl-CoA reductase (LuxC)